MAIAGARRAPFHRSIRRHRHRSGIALISVGLQVHIHKRLRSIYYHVRNTVRWIVTPVRMHIHRTDPVAEDRARIGINRRRGDIGVPETAAGERNESVKARALSGGHSATGKISAAGSTIVTASPTVVPSGITG